MQDKSGFPTLDIKAAKALRPNVHQIRIESILGGISPIAHFAARDQFLNSVGIDPSIPFTNSSVVPANSVLTIKNSTGLLAPVSVANIVTSATMFSTLNYPTFLVQNPKSNLTYVYCAKGSVFSYGTSVYATDFTALSDAGSMSGVTTANGAAYYDNYIYFAKDTDIARYGPLNGSPTFTGAYWTGTLSKAALTDFGVLQSLPTDYNSNHFYPQHVMHRHSDGKLYIADAPAGQGMLHVISTTKTTVEGDTDAGSAYQKLTFGYGLIPSAIESYGGNLAVALFEGPGSSNTPLQRGQRAKIAFWDTTSQAFNFITNDEFPDEFISAMKNINGVLYIASGNRSFSGFRVSQYVGGYSFKEVAYIDEGQPPYAGAMLGSSERLIFGSNAIYSLGLSKSAVSKGLFKYQVSANINNATIFCLGFNGSNGFAGQAVDAGWYSSTVGIDIVGPESSTFPNASYTLVPQHWSSQMYRIGQPFKITKIRIPLAQPLSANMTLTATIFVDGLVVGKQLTTINSAAYGTSTQSIVIRPVNLSGDYCFYVQLQWSGSESCIVSLPVVIDYELEDIDTAYP